METALSTISVLPSGKQQVATFTQKLKNEILASDRNPLPILVQLKYIEKVITETLKDEEIKYHFLKEFLLYDKEKIVTVNGAKLSESETGVKYDFNASGDVVWMDLDKQIKDLTEKRKERETFLKGIPYDEGFVDPEHGNFITRPPKTSDTMVKVAL